MHIAHNIRDPKGVQASLDKETRISDLDFYDLNTDMLQFHQLYYEYQLCRYQRQEIISSISLLEFVTLERLHERWQVSAIKPEDLRGELFGSVCYWEKVLQEHHITHIFLHTITPHWTYTYALYVAARLCNVHFFTVTNSFISERPIVHYEIRNGIEPYQFDILDAQISKFLDESSKDISLPETFKRELQAGSSWNRWLRNVVRYIWKTRQIERSGLMYSRFDYRFSSVSWLKYCFNFIRLAVKSKFELYFLKKFYNTSASNYSPPNIARDPFPIVFFAHLQPEAATCPNADFYHDARVIVHELKSKGFTVYYKEHPHSFVDSISTNINISSIYKSRRFYDDLLGMGVRFVPVETDNNILIEDFMAVATCTGTISLQAVAKGVPAIVFGAPWYMNMPGTVPARNGLQMTARTVKHLDMPSLKQLKDFFRANVGLGVPDPEIDGISAHLAALAEIAERHPSRITHRSRDL